jgi:hypothetical protein
MLPRFAIRHCVGRSIQASAGLLVGTATKPNLVAALIEPHNGHRCFIVQWFISEDAQAIVSEIVTDVI